MVRTIGLEAWTGRNEGIEMVYSPSRSWTAPNRGLLVWIICLVFLWSVYSICTNMQVVPNKQPYQKPRSHTKEKISESSTSS